jgi:hypothetical protein
LEALAKDPAKRFPTANDLLRALDQSLPTSMRASTDEEVAKFLRGLFNEQREEQRVTLNAALARADTLAAQGPIEGGARPAERKLRELLDSQPPPSAASHSGVSGIATLSGSEASAPSVATGDTTGVSQVLVETPELPQPPKRRSVWPKLIALALVVAGAAGALYLLRSRLPLLRPPPPAAQPAPPVAEAEPAPSPSPPPPPPPAVTRSAAVEPEPVASAAAESSTPPTAPVPARPAPARRSGSTRPAEPSAPKPGAPTWKQDPGF